MLRILRRLMLVALIAIALPSLAPTRASAGAESPGVDLGIPRPVMKFLKDNWKMLYIAFDELIDDLNGCSCPTQPPIPAPQPDPYPTTG